MKFWTMMLGMVLAVPFLQAYGQEQVVQEQPQGPWFLSGRLGAEFSDNRDGVKDNKENNTDVFVEPRADFRFRDGDRTVLNLAVLPMVKWHSNPRGKSDPAPQNDTELFGTAAVELMHQLSPRVTLNLADAATYNDDPEITNGANVRRSDNHILNTAHAAVDVAVTEKVVSGVEGNYTLKRYTDSIVANDEDEDIVNSQVYTKYMMGSETAVKGFLSYSDFKNNSTTRSRGSQVFGGGAGLEKTFNPDVIGKVMAGYQHGEYEDNSLDAIDTPNGSAELTMRAASDTRFRIGASYGLYAPYVRPYSIQKLMAVTGGIDHDVLPGRLTVSLNGQYGQGKYDSEGEALPGGNDDMFMVGLSAQYRINRTFSVQGGYTYENWDSDVRESFDRNMVNVAVKAEM